MTNKFIGILIIIGCIGVGYLYYTLKYLPNQQNAVVYTDINKESEIDSEKKVELVEVNNQDLLNNGGSGNLSKKEKINEIKLKRKFYKIIELEGNNKIYFKENGNKLDIFLGNKFIGVFDKVDKPNLRAEFIKGDYNNIYIEIGNNKYIYSISNNKFNKFDINLSVLYIKKGQKGSYLFVTEKGTFIYKIYDNKFEYFSFFNDFIYLDDGYIGIVNQKDIRRLKNLGFKNERNNLIVSYDPNTKKKKIILKTDIEIKEIYLKNSEIIVYDTEGKEYILYK